VRSIKRVILSFGTFEKVKLYKAWHLVEMTVPRRPETMSAIYFLTISRAIFESGLGVALPVRVLGSDPFGIRRAF
jgi:hypothetical protein